MFHLFDALLAVSAAIKPPLYLSALALVERAHNVRFSLVLGPFCRLMNILSRLEETLPYCSIFDLISL